MGMIQCRFCNWKTSTYRTGKGGKVSGPDKAYQRLYDHIENYHPEEYKKITSQEKDEQ